jgi:hypothetical protein
MQIDAAGACVIPIVEPSIPGREGFHAGDELRDRGWARASIELDRLLAAIREVDLGPFD